MPVLSPTVLEIEREIVAPVERVFAALSQAELLQKWHAPFDYTVHHAEVDLRVGGTYRITMKPPGKEIYHTAYGTYQEITPNVKLVYTWQWDDDSHPGVENTLVTLGFESIDGTTTKLKLRHERFPNEAECEDHQKGWNACLDNLPKALD